MQDGNARFTTVPLKLFLIKNVEDTVVFLARKMLISMGFLNCFLKVKNAQNHFCKEPANKNKQFKETKALISYFILDETKLSRVLLIGH